MQPMKDKTLTGLISINSKGVGFFDLETIDLKTGKVAKNKEDSIEIQPQYIHHAFHGDTVEIEKTGEKIKNREQGKVVRIVSRGKNEYVGTVMHNPIHDSAKESGAAVETFVVPDDKRMYVDIFLPVEDAKIPDGTKVLVKIDWEKSQEENAAHVTGSVTKIIGAAGENNTEMEAIVLEKGFRVEFPLQAEAEAEEWKKKYAGTFEEIEWICEM